MQNIEAIRRQLANSPELLAQFEALVARKNELTDADLEAVVGGKQQGGGRRRR